MRRVLVVHNSYLQRGGEDSVVESEVGLLRDRGHEVYEYRRSNEELENISRVDAAVQVLWSARGAKEVAELIVRNEIDIVHCHNTFPLISPSVYWAAARAGVPVVQTLHNFRLVCPQGLMLRAEKPCEECVGKAIPSPALSYACYRGSIAQTAVLVGMLSLHRVLGTWRNKVARYIALNEFCRDRFIAGGLPAERIVVKPNFVNAGPAPTLDVVREGVLFVGRLSHEKGVAVLADAMQRLRGSVPLKVVGAGPLEYLLSDVPGVRLLGELPHEAVMGEMARARLLVLPSICYENFPRTLVEAFACGLPVIASRHGAMGVLIRDGEDGKLFEAGNAAELANCIASWHADVELCRAAGLLARLSYESALTPNANYQQLMQIYADAAESLRS